MNNQPSNANKQSNFQSGFSHQSNVPITKVQLPTQIFQQTPVIHEEIRGEQVEEITPVKNIERLTTNVVQLTQPLYDTETLPVQYQERNLTSKILPDISTPVKSAPIQWDHSTVNYVDTANVVVEKAPVVMETEKRQIIEEIQPVIYKETIVPTVIRSTQPVYQKVIEGTRYSQEVLPPQQLSNSSYSGYGHHQQGGNLGNQQGGNLGNQQGGTLGNQQGGNQGFASGQQQQQGGFWGGQSSNQGLGNQQGGYQGAQRQGNQQGVYKAQRLDNQQGGQQQFQGQSGVQSGQQTGQQFGGQQKIIDEMTTHTTTSNAPYQSVQTL